MTTDEINALENFTQRRDALIESIAALSLENGELVREKNALVSSLSSIRDEILTKTGALDMLVTLEAELTSRKSTELAEVERNLAIASERLERLNNLYSTRTADMNAFSNDLVVASDGLSVIKDNLRAVNQTLNSVSNKTNDFSNLFSELTTKVSGLISDITGKFTAAIEKQAKKNIELVAKEDRLNTLKTAVDKTITQIKNHVR